MTVVDFHSASYLRRISGHRFYAFRIVPNLYKNKFNLAPTGERSRKLLYWIRSDKLRKVKGNPARFGQRGRPSYRFRSN